MDGGRVKTVLFHGLGNDIDIDLAVAEDDGVGAFVAFTLDQRTQNIALFLRRAVAA